MLDTFAPLAYAKIFSQSSFPNQGQGIFMLLGQDVYHSFPPVSNLLVSNRLLESGLESNSSFTPRVLWRLRGARYTRIQKFRMQISMKVSIHQPRLRRSSMSFQLHIRQIISRFMGELFLERLILASLEKIIMENSV